MLTVPHTILKTQSSLVALTSILCISQIHFMFAFLNEFEKTLTENLELETARLLVGMVYWNGYLS